MSLSIYSSTSFNELGKLKKNIYTHTHIYIYIYIYIGFRCFLFLLLIICFFSYIFPMSHLRHLLFLLIIIFLDDKYKPHIAEFIWPILKYVT